MAQVVEPQDWDSDAQNEALRKARELQRRDPEAASLLIATLAVTQDVQEQQGQVIDRAPNEYNPARTYDVMCKEYGWRPKDIDEMHYLTFFAMVREANARHERENRELRNS